MNFAEILFKRLPLTEKLWKILAISTEDWKIRPELFTLKEIFLHHDVLDVDEN